MSFASLTSRVDLPQPKFDSRNEEFQLAAARGKLVLPECMACGHLMPPPVANCTACLAEEFRWVEASGEGEVFSFVVYHRAWVPEFSRHLPYVVAIVSLPEGPRLVTNIVTDHVEAVRVGAPVRLAFEQRGADSLVPVFTLADEPEEGEPR